ncbi:MAG TPA: 4Fe-4S dicluster domain-containing protein [Bdellovibrionota bacterium]|nr:4Fe-4S dicluster domain-containing protein [Bdellovibrionota bacterium]
MFRKDTRWGERIKKSLDILLQKKVDRRNFLKGFFVAGTATALAASTKGKSLKQETLEKFLQNHYKEMSEEDKKNVFARIKREIKRDYDVDVTLSDPKPLPGVKFAYCLNLSLCNGSRYCVEACVKENNTSRDPQIQYIKVLEIDRGSMNFEKADRYYDGESVPHEGKYYIPVQCQQCDNPPCVKTCPVQATWKEPDGIVVIDYDWCIGCRYCQVACPYEARSFNFATPSVPKDEINPNQSYLSNRIRPRGVMEKCTFCLHRTRKGLYPACLEACPTGARKFGNILDPESEVSRILKEKKVFVLKEELNTVPQFFYYFD